jgi:hypothetical protein
MERFFTEVELFSYPQRPLPVSTEKRMCFPKHLCVPKKRHKEILGQKHIFGHISQDFQDV